MFVKRDLGQSLTAVTFGAEPKIKTMDIEEPSRHTRLLHPRKNEVYVVQLFR
jgi:hypothetical protein